MSKTANDCGLKFLIKDVVKCLYRMIPFIGFLYFCDSLYIMSSLIV